MYRISVQVKPYLAQFAKKHWKEYGDSVFLPSESVVAQTLVVLLRRRPKEVPPFAGNLRIELSERCWAKDLRHYSWLSEHGRRIFERSLETEFLRVLHQTMEYERHRNGRAYLITAEAFHTHYALGESLTTDALLKAHQRWKQRVRAQRASKPVQLEIDINKWGA